MLGNTNMEIILSALCPGQTRPRLYSNIFQVVGNISVCDGAGETFFTFNYKEGLKLAHKSHSLHRIIAEVTLTMKIATYLSGLVFLRTWTWTFLTTV